MISKENLDRLSTLLGLQVQNAKMGGTKLFERVQKIVTREYEECVDAIEKEQNNGA